MINEYQSNPRKNSTEYKALFDNIKQRLEAIDETYKDEHNAVYVISFWSRRYYDNFYRNKKDLSTFNVYQNVSYVLNAIQKDFQ